MWIKWRIISLNSGKKSKIDSLKMWKKNNQLWRNVFRPKMWVKVNKIRPKKDKLLTVFRKNKLEKEYT